MKIGRRAALASLFAAALPVGARSQTDGRMTRELIFAEVEANDRAGAFLVDTGAPTTVIDSAFADRIGARRGGEAQTLRGAGGFGAVPGRIIDNLKVQARGGPAMQLDPPAADLSGIAAAMQRPLDGILGGDYLARLIVELDYRSGGFRVLDPSRTTPPATSFPLAIRSTPYIQATVTHEGRRAAAVFQIDTGSNTAVEFSAAFARRAFPQVRGETVDAVGLTGETHKRIARLDLLEVAGLRHERIDANFADVLRPDDAGRDYAGIVGGPVFAGRVVVIDYGRARLWFP